MGGTTHVGTGGTRKIHLESRFLGERLKNRERSSRFLVKDPLRPFISCPRWPRQNPEGEGSFEGYFGRTLNRRRGRSSVTWVFSYFPIFLKITPDTGTASECLTSAASYVRTSHSHTTSQHFQLRGVACVNPLTGMQLAEPQRERSPAPLSLQECVSVGASASVHRGLLGRSQ